MVVTAGLAATMLLYDWGARGQENVFSGVRPAVRRALACIYDSDANASGRQASSSSQQQRDQPTRPA